MGLVDKALSIFARYPFGVYFDYGTKAFVGCQYRVKDKLAHVITLLVFEYESVSADLQVPFLQDIRNWLILNYQNAASKAIIKGTKLTNVTNR